VKQQMIGVGQVWMDWDIRMRPLQRMIKIVSISGDGQWTACKNLQTGRITKIRADRFKPNSTGYKYVSG